MSTPTLAVARPLRDWRRLNPILISARLARFTSFPTSL